MSLIQYLLDTNLSAFEGSLEAGCNPNGIYYGSTILSWATRHRKPEFVRALLRHDASDFEIDHNCRSVYHWAAIRPCFQILQMFWRHHLSSFFFIIYMLQRDFVPVHRNLRRSILALVLNSNQLWWYWYWSWHWGDDVSKNKPRTPKYYLYKSRNKHFIQWIEQTLKLIQRPELFVL